VVKANYQSTILEKKKTIKKLEFEKTHDGKLRVLFYTKCSYYIEVIRQSKNNIKTLKMNDTHHKKFV